jgi:RHS repeat-associated protein
MLTEDYTGQSGTELTNTYDSCTYGKGYLCTASSTSAKTSNAYDILGRVSIATTTITNADYTMAYTYDRQGNIASTTYPNGSVVEYVYNSAGSPSRIQRKPSGGSFSNIISNYDYAPNGQALNVKFGNNASTTYFYDANALYRLSNLQTTGNASTTYIQKFAYTYDPVGNITQLNNFASASSSAATAYVYDALNRLTSAAASASSSPYTQQFTYDSLGNMLTNVLSSSSATSTPTVPSILDTLLLTNHILPTNCSGSSDSFSYTVPAGGTTKLLLVLVGTTDNVANPTATQNGVSLAAFTRVPGTVDRAFYWYSYLAAPTSGTFSINFAGAECADYWVMTLQDGAQSSPADASYVTNSLSASSKTTSTTTSVGNDLLLSISSYSGGGAASFGSGETQTFNQTNGAGLTPMVGSWKAANGYPATESMTTNISSGDIDEAMVALKGVGNGTSTTTTSTYTYAGTDYANPHAVTQIANGLSTTTFTYDNNGNVTQKTTDGTTTTYVWDYANRLTALGVLGATTTYGYDAFGNRVLQTGTSTTYVYPNKWYSIASSTGSGAKYSTTTEYVFNSDSLVATIDQQTAGGTATGTAKTRYIHPDHLGSTNVVTDENGNLVQTLDYYPYGSTRVSVATSTNEKRQFIGQFTDDSTLSYLNARYYDPSRGEFLSEDPTVLAVGTPDQLKQLSQRDQRAFLSDPQQLNSYSYGRDNPVTQKDPNGLFPWEDVFTAGEWLHRGMYANDLGQYLLNNMPSEETGKIAVDGTVVVAGAVAQMLPFTNPVSTQLMLGSVALQGLDYVCANAITCRTVGAPPNLSGPQIAQQVLSTLNPTAQITPGGQFWTPPNSQYFNPTYSNIFSTSIRTRIDATKSFNASTGNSSGGSGGGAPSSNSLWVTPSGAVVTFGGSLVAPPPPPNKK